MKLLQKLSYISMTFTFTENIISMLIK